LGPNSIAALTTGALLRGTWFDRSKEFLARQRGEHTLPMQFATTFDVKLTPLPCLLDLTEDERQATTVASSARSRQRPRRTTRRRVAPP
jgi:hypothetical protein